MKNTLSHINKLRTIFRMRNGSMSVVQVLSLAALLAGLPVALYLVLNAVRVWPKAVVAPSHVFFAPTEAILPPNQTLELKVDVKTYAIGFAHVELTFDRTKVNLASEITTTDLLKTVVQKTSKDNANATGRVVIALGLSTEDMANPPTDIFSLGSLTFTAATSAQNVTTPVSIDPSRVELYRLPENLIPGTTVADATLTVNPTGGPTNTPTPPPPLSCTKTAYAGTEPIIPPISSISAGDTFNYKVAVTNIGTYGLTLVDRLNPSVKFITATASPSCVYHATGNGFFYPPHSITCDLDQLLSNSTNDGTKVAFFTVQHQVDNTLPPSPRLEVNAVTFKQGTLDVASGCTNTLTVIYPTPSPTPTTDPTKTTLTIKIRLQGITVKASDQKLRFTFVSTTGTHPVTVFQNVLATNGADGVYTATIPNITSGQYNLYVKSPSHLQRAFPLIMLDPGIVILDLTKNISF